MSKLLIHLDCIPPTATAQQKGERIIIRKGKRPFIVHYKKPELIRAEELFVRLLKPYVPTEPITGPVQLECQWIFPWRKTELKRVMKAFLQVPKTTKPDIDNSNKLLIDCLTQTGIIKDDSIIYDLHPTKWWGDKVGIYLKLTSGDSLPEWPIRKATL
jgi:Holliday junction resolvase RusA-like endonuclease